MLFLMLITTMIFAVYSSLNLLAVTPTAPDYQSIALKKARSVHFVTGSAPSSVTVINATTSVNPLEVTALAHQSTENIAWKKINNEQAILTVCNQIMLKCGTSDITRLFAFMPSNTGTLESLLTGTTSNTITCGNVSTYGPYGRYLLRMALNTQDTSHVLAGVTYNFRYNKPLSGSGCFYVDIVGT